MNDREFVPETYSFRQLAEMADRILEHWNQRNDDYEMTEHEREMVAFVNEYKRKFQRMNGEEIPAR